MSFRPTTLVVVTSSLIAAAGITGCQVPRSLRSFEFQSTPWRRAPQPRPRDEAELDASETYVPGGIDSPSSVPQPVMPPTSVPDQPKLRLPPEPRFPSDSATDLRPIPVPPAVEGNEPQARRWRPSLPTRQAAQGPQYSSQSDSSVEDFNLPPARVTYNSDGTNEETTSTSQPRLFRPAESAKSMFESMKRKLSR